MIHELPEPDGADPPRKLELDYPCAWRYRVIVEDAASLREAVSSMFPSGEYELAEGRASRAGTYVSMELSVEVRDEDHRHAILAELQGLETVRFVL